MEPVKSVIFAAVMVIGLASFRDASIPAALKPAFQVTDTIKVDRETGLIEDKNLTLVKAHCTGCHSTKLIGQHRFTREGWVGKIRWMQQNHNLWDLGQSEKTVLDYLEKYYSPESTANQMPARRTPLKNIEWYKL
jgi:hypothetical protein